MRTFEFDGIEVRLSPAVDSRKAYDDIMESIRGIEVDSVLSELDSMFSSPSYTEES